MKKILFVIYALNNGGAERSLVNLLTEIDFTNRAGRTGGLGIFSIEKEIRQKRLRITSFKMDTP